MRHFRKELLDDIGYQKFSIIMDESTDVSVSKHLGLVIRYYSAAQERIVSIFLELVSIGSADARGIVNGLVSCLENYNLDIKQMIGIGTESVSQRILIPRPVNRNLLDPIADRDINPRPYLGYMFETAQHNLDSEILNAIRQRCSTFLLQLLKELQQRLPDNYKQLESMALLSPEEAIKPIKLNTIIDVDEILGFTLETIDKIMQQ
ncbi:unnamed protein product [Parnassius apollo]|uniref:(apollo) hypothetical protein n=1 Tax=Parnassius apollo TaxID=110799 RepID=A0A8S3XQZ6_PARAO|nr:unnamed protein product [Parnassius apollo]